MRGRVLHEGLEDPRSRAPAAGVGPRRHPADPPIAALLALGSDEPHRHELVARERTERDGVVGLVLGELLDGHVRAEHVAPEGTGLRERDRAKVERGHVWNRVGGCRQGADPHAWKSMGVT